MNKINLITQPLPSPRSLTQQYPVQVSEAVFIKESRETVAHILQRKDPRLLLIVGPCSIHDISAAEAYAEKLKSFFKDCSDLFYPIMRVYFDKPRTTVGWKGLLNDPHLDSSYAIEEGLHMTRQLLLRLAKMRVPTATEFLDPLSGYFFGDLISWGCIGARTSESQTHRQLASSLPMPVAFKNSTSGSIEVAINGILAAAFPQTFIGLSEEGYVARVQSSGNPLCHLALRGGERKSNYDPLSIAYSVERLRTSRLLPSLIVDCAHDNSKRKAEQQIAVFRSLIQQIVEGEESISGLILESHLFAGNQPLISDKSKLKYAVSLTDPCLDWLTTQRLLEWGYEQLSRTDRRQDVYKKMGESVNETSEVEQMFALPSFPTKR